MCMNTANDKRAENMPANGKAVSVRPVNNALRVGLLLAGLGGLAAAGALWLHNGSGEVHKHEHGTPATAAVAHDPGDPHVHAPALHSAAGHDAGHAHEHGSEATGLTLDDGGRKWATDEALRTGMQAIRAQLMALPEPALPEQRQQLAAGIRDQVSYLIAHCKLEPRADAVLHVLIGQLLAGADALETAGNNTPGSEAAGAENVASRTAQTGKPDAIQALHSALADYGQYFDHPGWTATPGH